MNTISIAAVFYVVFSMFALAFNPLRKGSIVALVTPMKPDGSIDHGKLVELLEWHVKEGTDGAVILGTTGEGSSVSFQERQDIIKTSLQTVKNAFPIVMGTGTIDPAKVIELNLQARELGCDGALIITPYYVKPPQRALVEHYTHIAKHSKDLPIILYNCPGRTGVDMKPETVALCRKSHSSIVGVKDATGDLSRIAQFRALCDDKFLVYSGEDDSGCDFVYQGGDGVISVSANIAPRAVHTILEQAEADRTNPALIAQARASNDKLMLLHQKLFVESNPIPVKKAMQLMGKLDNAYLRPPMVPCAEEHTAILMQALQQAGVL